MDKDLAAKLKYLRLSNLSLRWDDYMALAEKGDCSPVQFLRRILEDEWSVRRENARVRRFKAARIPEPWVMETFPFDRQPKLEKKRILSVYDAFEFLEKKENLVWLGPTGSGKTGLATSFLMRAIDRGYTGRYVLFPELIGELYKSVADHSEEQVLRRHVSYDCLLVDEVGYVEVEPVQVGLFFTLMQRRHKRKSTLITSNLGFSEWRSFLKNDHLTSALIDRLTETSHVFNMRGCRSLRAPLGGEKKAP